MTKALQKLAANQVARFLLLGGFAAAVNWLIRFPLSLVLPLPAAVLAAYLIGMSVGFTLYRAYVFPGSTRRIAEQGAVFVIVNIVGALVVLALTTAIMALIEPFAWPLPLREGLAHGLAIGIGAIVNFFGHKRVTFRQSMASPALYPLPDHRVGDQP